MRYRGDQSSDPGGTFPKDDYFLTCTGVQDKDKHGQDLVSSKGNDMWVLEMTVAEGPFQNRKLWHYLVWLAPGAPGHGMTLKALKAFGIDPEGEADYHPNHLLNITVKANVDIQQSDGYEPKNVIKKWYTPEEIRKPGIEEGDAQEPADNGGDTSFVPPEPPVTKKAAPVVAAKRKPLWK